MSASDDHAVRTALVRAATGLTEPLTDESGDTSWDRRLVQLTRVAARTVPGADLVGLTLRDRYGVCTAPGADLAELDQLQIGLREGPSLDAIRGGVPTVVAVGDLDDERDRWPRFAPAAVHRGVHGVLSVALVRPGVVRGAVTVYSRTRHGFDTSATAIADAFALQAAVALHGATKAYHLERALETRDLIGQAKGILMHRHGIDADRAFRMLVGASQATNMKLPDVARWLISDAGAPVEVLPEVGVTDPAHGPPAPAAPRATGA